MAAIRSRWWGSFHIPAEFNHERERPDAPLVRTLSVRQDHVRSSPRQLLGVDTPITPPPTTATLILEKFIMNHHPPSGSRTPAQGQSCS